MMKITKSEIEQIIKEEISKIDEGFWDRVMSKATGNVDALKTAGSNLGKAAGFGPDDGSGQVTLKRPGMVRNLSAASERMKRFSANVQKMAKDIQTDIEKMFGGMENVPPQLGNMLKDIQGSIKSLSNISMKADKIVKAQGVRPEPKPAPVAAPTPSPTPAAAPTQATAPTSATPPSPSPSVKKAPAPMKKPVPPKAPPPKKAPIVAKQTKPTKRK